ncbi:hypothetical protein Q5P01_008218 [Channa striata]|uniref:SGNH hydrolase-type esterase domain-containing protein n=1 Tax=Channa striata TaxID=64152 RepID=A0AA88NAX3_CHASR|nr:hypothetical protein Q5P01_008218 [Channa striata]
MFCSVTHTSASLCFQKINFIKYLHLYYTKNEIKTKPPKIWIIGSSYINHGEKAALQNFGENFGLTAKVEWFGQEGMRWSGILPRLYEELSRQSPPNVLVVHAGGNDLGWVAAEDLVFKMQQELRHLHEEFPAMKLVYSCINERKVWRTGWPRNINKDRKVVNSHMRKALHSLGGEVIEHPHLHFYSKTNYLPDGVNFTEEGNEIFLSSIRRVLRRLLGTR